MDTMSNKFRSVKVIVGHHPSLTSACSCGPPGKAFCMYLPFRCARAATLSWLYCICEKQLLTVMTYGQCRKSSQQGQGHTAKAFRLCAVCTQESVREEAPFCWWIASPLATSLLLWRAAPGQLPKERRMLGVLPFQAGTLCLIARGLSPGRHAQGGCGRGLQSVHKHRRGPSHCALACDLVVGRGRRSTGNERRRARSRTQYGRRTTCTI